MTDPRTLAPGVRIPDPDRTMTPGARRILDAASHLFYDRGIHAVGVDLIAERSGVTKRTLYNRFGSKESLVAEYLGRRHESWWEFCQQLLADAPVPRALTVFDAYAANPSGIDRGCAFLNGAGELPDDHPGFAVIRAHKKAVRDLLGELIAEDFPAVPGQGGLADHLFLLLEGAISHSGIDHDDHRLRQARALAEELLVQAAR